MKSNQQSGDGGDLMQALAARLALSWRRQTNNGSGNYKWIFDAMTRDEIENALKGGEEDVAERHGSPKEKGYTMGFKRNTRKH